MADNGSVMHNGMFIVTVLLMTVTHIWGLKTIITELSSQDSDGQTGIGKALKADPPPGGSTDVTDKTSFSRVAGAFGAMALSTAVIGMSYWIVYALFYDPAKLVNLKDTSTFFLAGSVLFAPYAVSKMVQIFNITPPKK